jgi:predicted small metal-binding protein
MTYSISCRELGADCDFVATGPTPRECKRAAWGHVGRDHAQVASSLTPGMRAELEGHMDGILDGQMRRAVATGGRGPAAAAS